MDKRLRLILFTCLELCCLISTGRAQGARCILDSPRDVNNTHPSHKTNWTDTEQLARQTSFCSGGTMEIKCIDERGEVMGKAEPERNTSVYHAKCDTIFGLWCRPYGNQHCPDFKAIYTCTCPTPAPTTKVANSTFSAPTRKTSSDDIRRTGLPTTAAGQHSYQQSTTQASGSAAVANVLGFHLVVLLLVVVNAA